MLATQSQIDTMAGRIERAYRLRRPQWHGGCSTPRVWAVAARVMLEVHRADPGVPADPELYVAAQPAATSYPDPWSELTTAEAADRFRQRVRAIVRALRSELAREVKLAEERIGSGQAIGRVLAERSGRISPLGRFIVAQRAGRLALARRFATDAADQHRSCPLYREASRRLLAPGLYPVAETDGATAPAASPRRLRSEVHPN